MFEMYLIVWAIGVIPVFILFMIFRKHKFVTEFIDVKTAPQAFFATFIWPTLAFCLALLECLGWIGERVGNGMKKFNEWWIK